MSTQTQDQPIAKALQAIVPGKFNGMLANFQVSAYGSLKAFGMSKEVAHKIANDYASDLGNAMRSDDEFAAKVGKAKKNGDSVIKFSGKGGTKMTNAMAAIRVVQVLEGLRKEGLLSKATIKTSDFAEQVGEYITECETWATEQTWAKTE